MTARLKEPHSQSPRTEEPSSLRLTHQTSLPVTSRQKKCCECHIHAGGRCHLFHKDFTAVWPTYLCGLWVSPYDQGDH